MKFKYFSLFIILILAAVLRFYQLGQNPPSLGWDEAAIGYNAYSILREGKDEWGNSYPLFFKSFGEYKFPFHIYATVISEQIFGLSNFSVRFPSAFFGLLNIVLFYLLIKEIFGPEKEILAQISTLFLTLMPWHIHFSRIAWETNFTFFFFILGLIFFFRALRKQKFFLILSFLFFGLTLFTYNTARVFIPVFLFGLIVIFFNSFIYFKKEFLIAVLVVNLFIGVSIIQFNQSIGQSRFSAVKVDKTDIQKTWIFEKTKNKYFGAAQITIQNWLSHYSPEFLFIKGDSNPRHSQGQGQLLWIFLPISFVGILSLLQNPSQKRLLLLFWFLIWPLPAAIFRESPHASRAMFGILSFAFITPLGISKILSVINKNIFKVVFIFLITVITLANLQQYLVFYYQKAPSLYSSDWQYGYTQLVDYLKNNPQKYEQIIISDEYGQPYIFFLYGLKYSPSEFLKSVHYNPQENWGFSTVSSFDKFEFKKIDLNKETNFQNRLFVLNSEEWNKTQQKDNFKIISTINFLNGEPSFILVEKR